MGCTEGSKKKKKKRQHFVLDFENPLKLDMSKFEPPENPNSTLLVHWGGSCSSLLPPDLHYEALNLVTLFLKPTVQVSLSLSLMLKYQSACAKTANVAICGKFWVFHGGIH